MNILYLIVKVITFPGTLLKAFLEHCACRMTKTAMEHDKYFQMNEMCGHTEHELIERKGQAFQICFFPFIINLILGLAFTWAGSVSVIFLGEFFTTLQNVALMNFIYLYLGICFLSNLFPQMEDFLAFKEKFYGKDSKNLFLKIIVAPIFGIMYVGTYLEKTGLNIITSIVFAFFMPNMVGVFVPQLYDFIKSL